MEPENDGFQKESPFPVVDFQVNHVKLPGCSSGSSLPCFIKESQVQEQFGREGERLQWLPIGWTTYDHLEDHRIILFFALLKIDTLPG